LPRAHPWELWSDSCGARLAPGADAPALATRPSPPPPRARASGSGKRWTERFAAKKVLIFVPDSLTWVGSIVIIRHQIALTFGRPKLDAIIDRKDVIFTDRV